MGRQSRVTTTKYSFRVVFCRLFAGTVRRGDVLSVWSGIRPLVSDPNSKDTQSIARNHIIQVGENRLVTIAGGKWTTYRCMAEETVDQCIKVKLVFNLLHYILTPCSSIKQISVKCVAGLSAVPLFQPINLIFHNQFKTFGFEYYCPNALE